METMQPTLKNGRYVWDRINMPEAEFQERVKKIRKEMKKERLNLLLLYGHGYDEYGNYCYLSNYIIRLASGALVVLPLQGEPALIFEGSSRGVPSVRKTTWIEEIRASGDVSKEFAKYLEEKKLMPCTVGLVGIKSLMPYEQLRVLRDALKGWKILYVDRLLTEMRMVKSPREVDQIRRASRILSRAFEVLSGRSLLGPNEKALEGALCREVRIEGAEDFRMMIAKPGEKTWAFRPAEEAALLTGETVIIYLAVEFERYWTEAVRTFVMKEGSLVPVKRENVEALYEKAIQVFRPGKTASQFHKEVITLVRKDKGETIPDYGLGQGIGLSPREAPLLSGEDKTPLKEGMCVTFRLLVKDDERGAIMAGDTFHLTRHGQEMLTRS